MKALTSLAILFAVSTSAFGWDSFPDYHQPSGLCSPAGDFKIISQSISGVGARKGIRWEGKSQYGDSFYDLAIVDQSTGLNVSQDSGGTSNSSLIFYLPEGTYDLYLRSTCFLSPGLDNSSVSSAAQLGFAPKLAHVEVKVTVQNKKITLKQLN